MTDDDRKAMMTGWSSFGQQLLGSDGFLAKNTLPGADRVTVERLEAALVRLGLTVGAGGIALGMPLDVPAAPHAVAAAMRLVGEAGLRGFAVRSVSPAATRELLVNAAIEAGCDRMLMLGPDAIVDRQGLWQMMSTIERTGAAAIAGVAPVPVQPGQPVTALSAFVGQEGDVRRLLKEDVPTTGVAFPVHHLDGIVALMLDLTQIRRYQGPRWSSRTEGTEHISEDVAFAKWLDMHSLDLLVDPKVTVARLGEQLYAYRWEPPKADET